MTSGQPKDRAIRWTPVDGETVDLALACITVKADDVTVIVHVEPVDRFVRLVFEGPIGFRGINETYRARTLIDSPEPLSGLYVVDPSEWVAWLRVEAGGVLDDADVKHYMIATINELIDVVTRFPPTVAWIPDGEHPPWP